MLAVGIVDMSFHHRREGGDPNREGYNNGMSIASLGVCLLSGKTWASAQPAQPNASAQLAASAQNAVTLQRRARLVALLPPPPPRL